MYWTRSGDPEAHKNHTNSSTVYRTNQPGILNTEHHNWRDKHNTKTRTRHRWTGKSIFQKMNAEQPNEDDALPNAVPIRPDSTEGVRASLAGMRTQLAAAQRRDPRLLAIIRALKGEPRGNYVSDSPVADGRRLKTRLYKYRLASDGVLVARPDNDDPSVDRPVVPDATYEYGTDRAPSNMTWKHLLLGAVHNNHRPPQESC